MQTPKNQTLKTVGAKALQVAQAVPAERKSWAFPRTGMVFMIVLLAIAIGLVAYLALAPANPAAPDLSKADRLQALAQVKDDVSPAAAILARLARIEELGRIKDGSVLPGTAVDRASRIYELGQIKDDVVP